MEPPGAVRLHGPLRGDRTGRVDARVGAMDRRDVDDAPREQLSWQLGLATEHTATGTCTWDAAPEIRDLSHFAREARWLARRCGMARAGRSAMFAPGWPRRVGPAPGCVAS